MTDGPKALLPVDGRPFLLWLVEWILRSGYRPVLATGVGSEAIERAVQAESLSGSVTIVPESVPLGTGGAVANARHELSNPFVTLNADTIVRFDLDDLMTAHLDQRGVATMVLHPSGQQNVGAIGIDQSGRVRASAEAAINDRRAARWLSSTGVLALDLDWFEAVCPSPPFSLESDVMGKAISGGGAASLVLDLSAEFYEWGTVARYQRVSSGLAASVYGDIR